jgi:hypothetical protein
LFLPLLFPPSLDGVSSCGEAEGPRGSPPTQTDRTFPTTDPRGLCSCRCPLSSSTTTLHPPTGVILNAVKNPRMGFAVAFALAPPLSTFFRRGVILWRSRRTRGSPPTQTDRTFPTSNPRGPCLCCCTFTCSCCKRLPGLTHGPAVIPPPISRFSQPDSNANTAPPKAVAK